MIYHILRRMEDTDVIDTIEADTPQEAVDIAAAEMKNAFAHGWDDANPLSRQEYLRRVDLLFPDMYYDSVMDIKEVVV
jgi:hypothetical protein